ncbi:MAG: SRPBCC domain-containing protein [bacterium]
MATLRQSVLVHAPVAAVRDALLDSGSLSKVLGHSCEASAEPGGSFSLWDGLIRGHNARLGDAEIVQTWRYALPEWPEGQDSNLILQLREEGGATRVALAQNNIPQSCAVAVEEHWREHVWPGIKALLERPQRRDVGRGLLARLR